MCTVAPSMPVRCHHQRHAPGPEKPYGIKVIGINPGLVDTEFSLALARRWDQRRKCVQGFSAPHGQRILRMWFVLR